MRTFGASAKLLLTAIAVLPHCGPCTIVYPAFQVGTTFQVRVEDRGRPVEGLKLEIGGGHNRVGATTNKNGVALFRRVPPGSYQLSADHDTGVPAGADLKVKIHAATNVTVPLHWPSTPSLPVRSLKGGIRAPDYLPGQPQPRFSLDLLEGSSGRLRKSVQATESGEFDFESAASGLYFIRLKSSGLVDWSGQQITGLIAVAVDPDAANDHLDLDVGWSSCGLLYADSSHCSKGDLEAERLSGRVVDPTGAAIAHAKIVLLDAAGTLIEQLQTDWEGKFASPRPQEGTYELVVSSPGFTPFRRKLRAQPGGESARPPVLTVQLGLVGSCSVSPRRRGLTF